MSYIRFQTGMRCRRSGRSLGIFRAAGELRDDGRVASYFDQPLDDALDWFNQNLAVPRRDSISQKSVFWFDRSSAEVIGNVWVIVCLLRQHDVYVQPRVIRDPGVIVYRDEHQVAAIPSQSLHRRLINF